ncbi:MAG: PEP-CTERM sorting domain-containing protein [Nitrosospira sp.]
MKIASLNFAKRNVASVLLTTSAIMSITAATDAMSAVFTVNAIIEEETGFKPGCASLFGGTITGSGVSSLGRVSLEGGDCITPMGSSLSFEGKMTFNLSRGNEIFADYHGLFTPTGIGSLYTFTDSFFEITGGTGNFLHATGGGTLLGGEDISSGLGVLKATGTISNFDKNHKGKKKDEDRGIVAGNATAISTLDNGLFPASHPLGDYFYQDQNGTLLAVNTLPESGSLALLGIGLASLVALRRRKLANFN